MSDDDWIESTITLGGGTSNVQTVSTTGNVDFTGTGLSMDFTAKTGTDDIVDTCIDSQPNENPCGINTVFDEQYWVVNQYGTGTFEANLTFIIDENLIQLEEDNPGFLRLYTRESNSDGAWAYLTDATIVDAENKNKPFTDEHLTGILKQKGYNIARRTVAKYREQLSIPVARLRKEL